MIDDAMVCVVFNNAEDSLQDGSHLFATQHPLRSRCAIPPLAVVTFLTPEPLPVSEQSSTWKVHNPLNIKSTFPYIIQQRQEQKDPNSSSKQHLNKWSTLTLTYPGTPPHHSYYTYSQLILSVNFFPDHMERYWQTTFSHQVSSCPSASLSAIYF